MLFESNKNWTSDVCNAFWYLRQDDDTWNVLNVQRITLISKGIYASLYKPPLVITWTNAVIFFIGYVGNQFQ